MCATEFVKVLRRPGRLEREIGEVGATRLVLAILKTQEQVLNQRSLSG